MSTTDRFCFAFVLLFERMTLGYFHFSYQLHNFTLLDGNGLLNLSESELIILLGRNVDANFAAGGVGGAGNIGQQQGLSEDIIASLPTRIIPDPVSTSLNSKEEDLTEEVVGEIVVEAEVGEDLVEGPEASIKAATTASLGTDLEPSKASSSAASTAATSSSSSSFSSCSVDTCPICMDALAPGHVAKHLPCLHAFHAKCVDKWLRMSRRCPMCNHCVSDE